jgi:hypothetical protein
MRQAASVKPDAQHDFASSTEVVVNELPTLGNGLVESM